MIKNSKRCDVNIGDEDCKSGAKTVPHPEDCQKYIVCDTTSLKLSNIITCSPEKLYSTEKKSCQPFYTVTCLVGPSTPAPQAISFVDGMKTIF